MILAIKNPILFNPLTKSRSVIHVGNWQGEWSPTDKARDILRMWIKNARFK